jgi:hypothetical protein
MPAPAWRACDNAGMHRRTIVLGTLGWLARAAEMRLEDLPLLATIPLRASLDHVQGIEVEGGTLWVSSVDRAVRKGFLHEFSLGDGTPVRQVEVQRGEQYHPGGIAADTDSIWVPVAEYRKESTSTIERRAKATLETLSSFAVDDHIGCIAVSQDRIWAGNWDAQLIYEWALDGTLLRKRENLAGTRYQDMKFVNGQLAASGLLGSEGAIDWLEPESLALIRRIHAGTTDRGVIYTQEGMAVKDGKLYLLPEDGPSRLFVFELNQLL